MASNKIQRQQSIAPTSKRYLFDAVQHRNTHAQLLSYTSYKHKKEKSRAKLNIQTKMPHTNIGKMREINHMRYQSCNHSSLHSRRRRVDCCCSFAHLQLCIAFECGIGLITMCTMYVTSTQGYHLIAHSKISGKYIDAPTEILQKWMFGHFEKRTHPWVGTVVCI